MYLKFGLVLLYCAGNALGSVTFGPRDCEENHYRE